MRSVQLFIKSSLSSFLCLSRRAAGSLRWQEDEDRNGRTSFVKVLQISPRKYGQNEMSGDIVEAP